VALPGFAELAAQPAPRLDHLALALAAEFRPVDADAALAELDRLGEELSTVLGEEERTPQREVRSLVVVLGGRHGFVGDEDEYDHPDNSMLDLVLERRKGLPILLSVVYAEVARRAEVPLAGVGLPGHFVTGHFGTRPPLLLDPFGGGALVGYGGPEDDVRPWIPAEIALRMLNNLVGSFARRGDGPAAARAAELRHVLDAEI
jgi:regulator of sirC expression with transglutaminase-like and TPR domain